MKPFLILQLRPLDVVSDNEFEAFLRYGGLKESEVHRVRMEQGPLPAIDLDDYAGVIIGGGPSNISDKEEKKSQAQKRFEQELEPLMREIVKRDVPYLGACYGLGVLTEVCGGQMGKGAYAEDLQAADIYILPEGQKDPLLAGLPSPFLAVSGHKESCQQLPEGAVVLASSDACPTHMFRIGQNVYATQFHPEADQGVVNVRADAYQHEGYFPPDELDKIKAYFADKVITTPMEIMKRFVDRYR